MPPITRSKSKLLTTQPISSSTPSTIPTVQQQKSKKLTGKKRTRKIEEVEKVEIQEEKVMTTIEQLETTKKIKLTEEESNLNGAPVGELFDVAVLSEEQMTPLNDPENEITIAFNNLISTSTSTSSSNWASRHNSIEIIRRGCQFHTTYFTADIILQLLNECCLEVESLRSCVSRNAILCLKAIYKLNITTIEDILSGLQKSINLLMNKSSGGPKFLSNLASESLEIGVLSLPFEHLLVTLQPFTSHKNAEISSRSYSLVAQRCLTSLSSFLSSPQLQAPYCQYLAQGLHSFRPQSREICKKALLSIFQIMNKENIQEMIDRIIPIERKPEIVRLLEESQKKVTSSSSAAAVAVGEKENKENKEKNRPTFRPAWKQIKNKQQQQHNANDDESISVPSADSACLSSSTAGSLLII